MKDGIVTTPLKDSLSAEEGKHSTGDNHGQDEEGPGGVRHEQRHERARVHPRTEELRNTIIPGRRALRPTPRTVSTTTCVSGHRR